MRLPKLSTMTVDEYNTNHVKVGPIFFFKFPRFLLKILEKYTQGWRPSGNDGPATVCYCITQTINLVFVTSETASK